MRGIDEVKLGLWADHSRGSSFLGKVITVDYRTGAIVTLSTILVTFAANRSWKLWRLLLHTLLTRLHPPRDADARLHQAILRNIETTGSALLSFFEIFRSSPRSMRLIGTAIMVFTLVHWVGYSALGLLTISINLGPMVLSVETDRCGYWYGRGIREFEIEASPETWPTHDQWGVHTMIFTNKTRGRELCSKLLWQ